MDDRYGSRSGFQTAADLAHAARLVYSAVRAAAVTGVKGAAITVVKETLPFFIKLTIGIFVAVLLIPAIIFTALPNMFFGYGSSDSTAVKQMTEQAMAVGGAYMSLEEFERSYIDAAVTSIVSEYESEGVSVDNIEVESEFGEEDLLWFIAIKSVAYQQNLDAMSVDSIRAFSVSRLSYIPSLGILEGGNDGVVTTLKIAVKKLDPTELMDELGFDEDAKTWAGALYETLYGSGALEEFAPYFEAYRPSYGGDTSYSGDIEYGAGFANDIDISAFTSPGTKNNLDLAAYAVQAWENNWGYVWGTYGNVLTQSLFDYKLKQYPDGVGSYEEFIRENWLGRRTADCVGLIKGYGWLNVSDLTIGYAVNGMPDYGANQIYQAAVKTGVKDVDYGPIDTMPEIIGLAVWKDGHIGVYIGNGYVIEAMSTKRGVVKTQMEGRGWSNWCKIPYINYVEVE